MLFDPFEFEVTSAVNMFASGPGQVDRINASGVCCGSWPVSPERRSPATWSVKGKLKRLKSGELGGFASRINTAGDVAGFEFVDQLRTMPVAWIGGERILIPMPEGALTGIAFGINDAGVITGQIQDGSVSSRGVRWIDGEIEILTDRDGRVASNATSITNTGLMAVSFVNDAGTAYVEEIWSDDGVTPITLPETEGTTVVTDLAPDGTALLLCITADGMTGYASLGSDVSELEAPESGENRIGLGINASGEIVGYAWEKSATDSASRAVIWTDNDPVYLNALLPDDAGVTLTKATSINDRGAICGLAQDEDGQLRGFVLAPGEDA
jgi:hypothetical protein